MNLEQKFFIQILTDFIHGKRSKIDNENVNWDKIFDYAAEQTLAALCYVQLRDIFPNNRVKKQFQRRFYSEVYLYANRQAEIDCLIEACSDVDIILMKGMELQDYYPVPVVRSMGDIDIVTTTENRKKIDAVLLKDGYEKMVDNHAVWTYMKDPIEFEIHNHMFYEHLSNNIDYQGYFDDVWNHSHLKGNAKHLYVPDESFHFVYLMTHLAKHIINKGMGFRSFIDLVLFTNKANDKMDWKWIELELKKLKLYQFTKTCFALCEKWFHVKMPIETEELDKKFYAEVTAKMFRDGMFGLENSQNEGAHSAKEVKRSGRLYWLTAIKLSFKLIFPPYRDMQLIPWYRFVDGRPWLMPIAWVYRWFYTATHKFYESKKKLIEPYKKRKVIEKRKKFIDNWGL